jgi:RNA polymerase II subunit A-like phosphatase
VEAKQDDGAMGTADDMKETKDITTENNLEKTKENSKESEEPPLEKTVEENVPKQTELSSESEKSSAEKENGQIHIRDTDDYLLHLQDILRNIHGAYYELYDGNQENGDETKAVPDMKIVLPYVRRKTLKEVHVVFSGVVPTNTPLERSKPYLVAKSLGANIMTRVSEETTHIIAARLGTAKVNN